MMVAQFFIQVCFIMTLLVVDLKHFQWTSDDTKLCGPIANETFFEKPVVEFIKENSILWSVY